MVLHEAVALDNGRAGLRVGARPRAPAHLDAARRGDERATEALLLELLPRVRNLVRYLVRGDSEADDLVQDSLIAILRGLNQYSGQGAFRSWVDRVVFRAVLDGRRSRMRRLGRLLRLRGHTADEAPVLGRRTVAPDDQTSHREEARLLDMLPTVQRDALVLHYVLEMSVPEMAEELGISPETVRSRLRVGRTSLRAKRESIQGRQEP